MKCLPGRNFVGPVCPGGILLRRAPRSRGCNVEDKDEYFNFCRHIRCYLLPNEKKGMPSIVDFQVVSRFPMDFYASDQVHFCKTTEYDY